MPNGRGNRAARGPCRSPGRAAQSDRAAGSALRTTPLTKLMRYIIIGEYMKNFDPIAAARTSRRSDVGGAEHEVLVHVEVVVRSPPRKVVETKGGPRPQQSQPESTKSAVSSHLYQAVAPARSAVRPGRLLRIRCARSCSDLSRRDSWWWRRRLWSMPDERHGRTTYCVRRTRGNPRSDDIEDPRA